MLDENKGFVLAALGVAGGIIPMVQQYRDSDGSYDKKKMMSDFLLLFVAGAPIAFFTGQKVISEGGEGSAFVFAYLAGIIANEIAKVLVSKTSAMISIMTGGRL